MSRPAFEHFPADRLPLQPSVPGARLFAVTLEHCRLTYFEVEPDTEFPEHEHRGEQITLVLSGELSFRFGDREVVVGPGEAVSIPPGVRHAVRCLGRPVTAVDAWSPPFDDWQSPDPPGRRR